MVEEGKVTFIDLCEQLYGLKIDRDSVTGSLAELKLDPPTEEELQFVQQFKEEVQVSYDVFTAADRERSKKRLLGDLQARLEKGETLSEKERKLLDALLTDSWDESFKQESSSETTEEVAAVAVEDAHEETPVSEKVDEDSDSVPELVSF